MALAEGQVHLFGTGRDLLMGAGTRFDLQDDFNPFSTTVRPTQGGDRPYAHGAWVGSEWMAERVVPIRVIANGAEPTVPSTRVAVQDMAAAFSAIGSTGEIAELRYRLDEDPDEFVVFGRPRGIDPSMVTFGNSYAYVSTAFIAADPRTYSGVLSTVSTGLPLQQGGLTVPFTVPYTIPGTLTGGFLDLVNVGTTATGMTVRIDGPAIEPRLFLRRSDGTVESIRFLVDLAAGQWITIDTTRRLALLNDSAEANLRGAAEWDMDAYPLLPGTNVLRFLSAAYDESSLLTVSYRSAWW